MSFIAICTRICWTVYKGLFMKKKVDNTKTCIQCHKKLTEKNFGMILNSGPDDPYACCKDCKSELLLEEICKSIQRIESLLKSNCPVTRD